MHLSTEQLPLVGRVTFSSSAGFAVPGNTGQTGSNASIRCQAANPPVPQEADTEILTTRQGALSHHTIPATGFRFIPSEQLRRAISSGPDGTDSSDLFVPERRAIEGGFSPEEGRACLRASRLQRLTDQQADSTPSNPPAYRGVSDTVTEPQPLSTRIFTQLSNWNSDVPSEDVN
ncbi:hypothetical protein MHYP_G00063530 [Metynnis hypsauchen]